MDQKDRIQYVKNALKALTMGDMWELYDNSDEHVMALLNSLENFLAEKYPE